jgi:translation initiation factor eIF-2B subunit alpha
MLLFKKAWLNHKVRFKVIVTESLPPFSGQKIVQNLRNWGISCTLIPDAAVAFVMDKVDMVLVGAEGVTQSGGIINQVSFYSFLYLLDPFSFESLTPFSIIPPRLARIN